MASKLTNVFEKLENGTIRGGKSVRTTLEDLPPGRYLLEISKHRKTRSTKQNAFYFANFLQSQIDCFKERWGYSYNKTQVHEWNKQHFWGDEHLNEDTGEVIRLLGGSSDKNTVEWEETLDIIRSWFMEKLDWQLPFPEKQATIF